MSGSLASTKQHPVRVEVPLIIKKSLDQELSIVCIITTIQG